MTYQTSVQNSDAIRIGSCKLEVKAHPGTFTDMINVGILRGAKIVLNRKVTTFLPDNAAKITLSVQNTGAEITATLYEWTLDTLEHLGIGTVVDTPTTPVTGTSLTIASGAWAYSKFVPVTNQPSASITSVAGSVNATLVEGTDYIAMTDENGVTGVILLSGGAISTLVQTMTIVYGYTPVASKTITIGGRSANPTYVLVQMTNVNADGDKLQYRLFKVTMTSNYEHTFTVDDDGEPAGIPITLEAMPDPDIADTANVIQIYDEQAV